MADDVEPGRRRHLGGQRARQLGVDDRPAPGAGSGARCRVLTLQLGDVEHGDGRRLGAGARRRRDREVRLQRRRRLPAAADRRVDVVHDRRRVGRDQVRDLRGVDARAAADRDEAVDLRLEREVGRVLEGLDRRLDARPVVDDDLDALRLDASRMRSGWPSAATPGSVTSIARLTPRRLSSQPASAAAPGPNLIGVASRVKTVSWSDAAMRLSPRAGSGACRRPRLAGGRKVAGSMPHATGRCGALPTRSARPRARRPRRRAPYETRLDRPLRAAPRGSSCAPATPREVAAVLAACAAHGVAVVPQGGNTGLVGAGVPRGGEVVLSLARLDAPRRGRPRRRSQVEAGAGVTLAALQAHARAAGLDAGVDFAARDTRDRRRDGRDERRRRARAPPRHVRAQRRRPRGRARRRRPGRPRSAAC